MSTTVEVNELPCRAALRRARRVCVKAGTSVVAKDSGRPSLVRLGAICEQISELVNDDGVQVIFVSSGAVGMGKHLLQKQTKMSMTLRDLQQETPQDTATTASSALRSSRSFVSLLEMQHRPHTLQEKKNVYDSACASAGQFEMMNLYSSLFAQCNVTASQLLVTQEDFKDDARRQNLEQQVDRLLSVGIVPIINENDAVSANLGYTTDDVFSDNDGLAAICARHFGAEVLLLLTDVPGVYDRPPTDAAAVLLKHYNPAKQNDVAIGQKSNQGRGGMASKIDAAWQAVQPGSSCSACVVASGHNLDIIRAVLGSSADSSGQQQPGTLFCTPDSDLEEQACHDYEEEEEAYDDGATVSQEARDKAVAARTQARKLQALPVAVRRNILNAMADSLISNQEELLMANQKDLDAAEKTGGVATPLKKRLKLTAAKLETLAAGLRQLASIPDPLNVCKSALQVADNLELKMVTVPIGVLMVIFESRPDSMPQIAALSIGSGNGLLLKGGKEAAHSNAAIHKVLGNAIETGSEGQVTADIVALVTSRGQVADMLHLDDVIDLVIPRGSNALVQHIKANTRIPVLGHADGVCHVYVDKSATDKRLTSKIVVDSKTDYPAACNAMETLLLHADTVQTGMAASILMTLRAAGVKCLGGPSAMKMGLTEQAAEQPKFEYGDLTCQVEVVNSMDDAIDWIHAHGSGHTETIVCGSDESDAAKEFLQRVDAACVFVNASTRFADGYRFGLGAEVGISTGRIHARGPVGVEGLLTTKWQLQAVNGTYHAVAEFGGDNPTKKYTHVKLPTTTDNNHE